MYKKILSFFRGYWFVYIILMSVYSASSVLLIYISSLLLERVVDAIAIYSVSEAVSRNLCLLEALVGVAVVNFGVQYIKFNFYNLLKHRITVKIFGNIIDAPYQKIVMYNSGDFYSAVSSDLPLALSYFDKMEGVLFKIAGSLGSALYIFQMDVHMGFVIMGFGNLIVIYNQIISPYLKKIQSSIQTDNSNIEKYTTEQYKSFVIRKFYDYQTLNEKYNKAYNGYIESNLKRMKYGALTSILGYLIGFLQTYIPLFLIATVFRSYSIGEIIALIGNITSFIGVFRAFGNLLVGVKISAAGAERLLPFMSDIEKNIECSELNHECEKTYKIGKLRFNYTDGNFNLSIDNLLIKNKSRVCFIGEKGSGKSTLLKLLAGLYEEYAGDIELLGNNLRNLNRKTIASLISYLPQNYPVFDMSIYENFKMVAPDKDERDYMKYASYVNMDTEIMKMEDGIHTPINSNKVSTGQRQRLSLCMVLLRETPVIILDEPTSNLDSANKHLIYDIISRNKEGGKLYIVATHDSEGLTDFDEIFCVENGRIGNH